jgi:hypothetical protein
VAKPSVFAQRMKQLGQRIEKNSDALVRKCALAVDATVVLATPVDTGRARANWQVELNAPAIGTTTRLSPSGAESIAAARTKIAQYKGGTPKAAIHITNNLPYIGKLNDGYSKQAPAGFVEKAVMVGVSAIQNVKVTRTVR